MYVSHNMTTSSVESEDLIENIEDPEDEEKYTACKILFSYQFCVIIMVSTRYYVNDAKLNGTRNRAFFDIFVINRTIK